MPKYQLVTFLSTGSPFPSLHCTSYFPMFSPSFCSSRARERVEHPLQGNIQTVILCVQPTKQLVAHKHLRSYSVHAYMASEHYPKPLHWLRTLAGEINLNMRT